MSAYPYSRYSNPIGAGKLSAEEIDLSFGPAAQGIGAEIIRSCERLRLSSGRRMNSDLVAGGIHLETGGGTSRIFLDKRNPGGIGAENDNSEGTAYDKAITFPTRAAGVDAYVAGLITYNDLSPLPEVRAFDPRFGIRKQLDYVGIVQREDGALYEYEQRYAHTYPESVYEATPGHERYGHKIALRTNEMYVRAKKEQRMVVAKPMMVSLPSPNRGGYDPAKDGARVVEAYVEHIATGTKKSNLDWLTKRGSGASANYYIARDGTTYEMVPWQTAAWTNGDVKRPNVANPLIKKWFDAGWNPNQRTVTIENEGEPGDTLTAEQLSANIHLLAWLQQETGVVPVPRKTLLGHYEINSIDRPYCPSFSEQEWSALADGAQKLAGGDTVTIPTPAVETGERVDHPQYGSFWIINLASEDGPVPMLDGFRAAGGLAGWGHPIGGMTRGSDGVYRQPFENGIAEVYPRGFDGKSATIIRLGGILQNWVWYRAYAAPILRQWGVEV